MSSLCACVEGRKEAPLLCVPLAAPVLTSITTLFILHYYFFIVHMSVSPTKAVSSLKVFLCPQYLAQCLTYSRLHTFLYYSLLLVYCKDVKFNKQNKEDRAFWAWGSINVTNIIYNYLYL